MKTLPLIAFIFLVGCGQKQETKVNKSENAGLPISDLCQDCDSVGFDGKTVWVNPKYRKPISEDSLASIERSLIPKNLKDSIDWKGITINGNKVSAECYMDKRKLYFIQDSIRKNGFNGVIFVPVHTYYFK